MLQLKNYRKRSFETMKRISFKDSGGLNLTQAVLDGRKTMTRRVVKGLPEHFVVGGRSISTGKWGVQLEDGTRQWLRPPYEVGDVVAIQQAYRDAIGEFFFEGSSVEKKFKHTAGWTNKMFVKAELMPHHIRITDVRVEQLRDISDVDCMREGVQPVWNTTTKPHSVSSYYFDGADYVYATPSKAFADLIDKVCGRGTWESNPLVWVYSFELID